MIVQLSEIHCPKAGFGEAPIENPCEEILLTDLGDGWVPLTDLNYATTVATDAWVSYTTNANNWINDTHISDFRQSFSIIPSGS